MARVVALIQARVGSTRLPGKVIADVCGRPVLWHIADRLRHCRSLSGALIATSEGADCRPVRDVAAGYGLQCFSGSEQDLVDRLTRAAQSAGADAIVRVTADCPFVDPALVDRMVETYFSARGSVDCVVNYIPRTFPHGLDLEVYPTAFLEQLCQEISDEHDREWFPTYVTARPELFRICAVTHSTDLSGLRWTVDYPEDLEFCRAVYTALWRDGGVFGMNDILQLLDREPSLVTINAMHAQHPSTLTTKNYSP